MVAESPIEKIEANTIYTGFFMEQRNAESVGDQKRHYPTGNGAARRITRWRPNRQKQVLKRVEAEISRDVVLIDGLISDIQALRN